jgi:hypothetical protein
VKPIGLDLSGVYAGLKDFQRDTVDYVFDRLYGGGDAATPRVLVADEVGLGKTLVARGLIAKTIEHLERDVRRIDVVYVCSNSEIARQNIQRLNVTGKDDFALASRVTLLPLVLHRLTRNRLNFVSFTPGTSLDLKSTGGIARERALLHRLLSETWGKSALRTIGARRVFQGDVKNDANFRWYLRDVGANPLDRGLVRRFAEAIERHDRAARKLGEAGSREQFEDLRERFRRERKHRPQEDLDDRRRFVGSLRDQLAHVCMNALEPDLVILDEFQRFKHLLRADDPAGELAQQLFAFRDHRGEPARVVLLSATPYKMYTIAEDVEDDHYADLIDTVRFLFGDEAETEEFSGDVQAYREALFRLDPDNLDQARNLKNAVEAKLRRVMVRTERLSTTPDRNGMLIERRPDGVRLNSAELESFVAVDGLARALDAGDVLEYWKSAPYLLNFMDGYKLSNTVDRMAETATRRGLDELVRGQRLIRWEDIESYRRIDPENPRLRGLGEELLDAEAWRLLWIPPSLPYYGLRAPFASARQRNLTKRLVFSAWAVAPKAIAALLSYEAERRMLGKATSRTTYSEARVRLHPLLRFGQGKGRSLPGLPVLALLYPSPTLAELGDPLAVAAQLPELPAAADTLKIVQRQVAQRLEPLLAGRPTEGRADERWYWATPFLLDQLEHPDTTHAWLARPTLPAVWTGHEERNEDFARHVDAVRWLSAGGLGRPPEDLVDVVAHLAIAAPGVAALRALSRVTGGRAALTDPAVQDGAARIAWGFRSLFNLPEVTALVRRSKAYWKAVLDYCTAGCLQAVLDEYAHVLVEWLGVADREPREIAQRLAETMHNSIALRTATYEIRDFGAVDADPFRKRAFRARFALRFGDNRLDESRESYRPTLVREAFNSPFWPFVLATTSVGQEGLDFHLYCHSVMHWNLPANPVDLEQREGRVHRYKGHAIRKNVAVAFPDAAFAGEDGDPWQALFAEAVAQRSEGENDLVPSWVFSDGPARIERLVPTLPFSRDESRLAALKRSLAAYRLAFGQPRQEELIAFLDTSLGEDAVARISQELRIDLSPRPPRHSPARVRR